MGCRLAASRALPDEWDASLVLRAEGAAAEAAVLDAAAHLPCRVPALVAPAVPVSDDLGGSVLIATWPDGTDFVEIIGHDPDRARDLFQRLARTQAALHDTGSVQVGPGVPVFDLAAELDALGPAFEAEAGWLGPNAPTPAGDPVPATGGSRRWWPASRPTTTARPSRCATGRPRCCAEPELDLGWSLLSFWIAPFFANTRSERRGMIMIRDGLANLFRTGYEAARPVDAERVRYWQAFHAARRRPGARRPRFDARRGRPEPAQAIRQTHPPLTEGPKRVGVGLRPVRCRRGRRRRGRTGSTSSAPTTT